MYVICVYVYMLLSSIRPVVKGIPTERIPFPFRRNLLKNLFNDNLQFIHFPDYTYLFVYREHLAGFSGI